MQMHQGAPQSERSIRFGFHWAVHRQIDRVGRAIERGTNMGSQVGYLKNLCRPFWRDNQEWQEKWEEVKSLVKEEMQDRRKEERLQKLRQEQMNMLIDLLWDNGVLVDEGIPPENIEIMERET